MQHRNGVDTGGEEEERAFEKERKRGKGHATLEIMDKCINGDSIRVIDSRRGNACIPKIQEND